MIAIIIFFAAHLALLVGVTTPDKFYFDEVHYVPAAQANAGAGDVGADAQSDASAAGKAIDRAVNPELRGYPAGLALSRRAVRSRWRLSQSISCGLALFAAQGPAIAAALIAFFNQMLFVQSRIAMLDIFALAFGLFATAAFIHGFRKPRPQFWFALAGLACGLSIACKWSGLFVLATCIVIVAAIRLMQGWRTRFADATAMTTGIGPISGPVSSPGISPRALC